MRAIAEFKVMKQMFENMEIDIEVLKAEAEDLEGKMSIIEEIDDARELTESEKEEYRELHNRRDEIQFDLETINCQWNTLTKQANMLFLLSHKEPKFGGTWRQWLSLAEKSLDKPFIPDWDMDMLPYFDR